MAVDDTATLPTVDEVAALKPFQGLWNGLVFGEGTDYLLTGELAGLLDYEARIGDAAIPQGEGDISFSRYAASRYAVFPFLIFGPALTATLETRVQAWLRAFNVVDTYGQAWLVFKGPTRALMWRTRVARRRAVITPEAFKQGAVPGVAEMKLADPRVYDATVRHGVLVGEPGVSGGGFELAADLPIDMTSGEPGSVVAENGGTATAWPVLQIANAAGAGGPITEAVVSNETAGVDFHIVTDIVAGQTLVADFDRLARRAPGPHIHIDASSRYGGWQHPRTLFPILPGSNIVVRQVTGGTPTVRLDWLDTSL